MQLAWLLPVISFCSLPIAVFAQAEVMFQRSTLEFNKGSLKPERVLTPWRWERTIGTRRIAIRGDVVEIDSVPPTGPGLILRSPDNVNLSYRADYGDIAYFEGQPKAADPKQPPRFDPNVRRLDLKTGKWLPSIAAPAGKVNGKEYQILGAVIAGPEGVIVLTLTLAQGEEPFEGGRLVSYQVTFFPNRSDHPAWSKSFAAAKARGGGTGWLISATRPDYAETNPTPLTWLGHGALVCAGETQDLVCLDLSKGEELWRLARVWEYQRGFTGPSVWNHHLERFGLDSGDEELLEKPPMRGKDQSDKDWNETQNRYRSIMKYVGNHRSLFEGAVIGGPILLQHRIFIAVAKQPRTGWGGYLAECIVYEIGELGLPFAMTTIPRLVQGSQAKASGSHVVWACQRGAFVNMDVYTSDPNGGPGEHDALCSLDWYRQYRPKLPAGWLSADAAVDAVVFAPGYALRTISGGWINKQKDGVYRFVISAIEMDSGKEQTFSLAVPLSGTASPPDKNFQNSHVRGSYLLGITGLSIDGGRLRVRLATEKQVAELDFSLERLIASLKQSVP